MIDKYVIRVSDDWDDGWGYLEVSDGGLMFLTTTYNKKERTVFGDESLANAMLANLQASGSTARLVKLKAKK